MRTIGNLAQRGRNHQAERQIKNALIDAPNCVEANLALVRILSDTNRAAFAGEHLKRAQKTGGDTPALLAACAHNARSKTLIPQAVEFYKAAVEAAPGNVETWAALIVSHDAAGEHSEAINRALVAMDKFPGDTRLRRAVALAQAGMGDFSGAIRTLSAADPLPGELLDRGRYKDRDGDYDGAWADWMAGKAEMVKRGRLVFQRDAFQKKMADYVSMATAARQKLIPSTIWPAPSEKGALPIFVAGFPRSGTTMVETAIAAHSKITAGDELGFMPECANIMPGVFGVPNVSYPVAMIAAGWGENVAGLGFLRSWYIRRAHYRLKDQLAGNAFFTDKMCLNELHVPLIRRLFPQSPVFHVRRHPLDVIVSNMSYAIEHGWNYGASLEACAYVIRMVDEITQLYRQLWPGCLVPIRYENFVADHRQEINAIFAGIGLEPEEASYDFHLSPRWARTISHRQIKEPLYDRSVGRWKNYRKHLEPALAQLGDMMKREDYES